MHGNGDGTRRNSDMHVFTKVCFFGYLERSYRFGAEFTISEPSMKNGGERAGTATILVFTESDSLDILRDFTASVQSSWY